MNLKIALDVDGVLADVIHAWLSYSNNTRQAISRQDISEWDFWRKFNISKFDFYEELSRCWKSWEKIPPTEDGISRASKEIGNLGSVDIVTAREDSTHKYVKNWLKMHDVTFENYVGVAEGIEKAKLDYDVFIDDSPINADSMIAEGKSVILYSQPWNATFSDNRVRKINRLIDAVNIIGEVNKEA